MSEVALVVGGAGGIGAAIAGALRTAGMAVAVADRSCDDAVPGSHRLDVTDSVAVAEVIAAVNDTLGPVSVLVNAAGILRSSSLVKTTDEDWSALLDVNLTGTFHTIRAALPTMLDRKHGRIVNLASITPLRGEARSAAYAASKGGVLGMTKALSREVAHHGITVNAIAPGYVDTEMTSGVFTGAVRDSVLSQIPLRRLAEPDDIAGAAVYLAGPGGRYVTGQVIVVDGGVT